MNLRKSGARPLPQYEVHKGRILPYLEISIFMAFAVGKIRILTTVFCGALAVYQPCEQENGGHIVMTTNALQFAFTYTEQFMCKQLHGLRVSRDA